MKLISHLFILIVFFLNVNSQADFSAQITEQTKKAVVSVKTISNYSAYERTGTSQGTGFIIDKQKGLIVTNRHVVNPVSTSNYEITFYDGMVTEAKLKYYSQWVDVAFLEVDPSMIPANAASLKISESPIESNQEILIVGNNAGEEFSIQTGTISSLLDTDSYLDTQNFRISLNIRGGSSGSPVVNHQGDLVGIIHATSQTSASAVYVDYIKDFYQDIMAGRQVQFNNPGFLLQYKSLNNIKKYNSFPEDLIKEYNKNFPKAMFKALQIKYVFFDSKASKYLKAGDLLWKINGELVGPNLYKAQNKLNNLNAYDVEIFRNGKKYIFKNIPTYPSYKNKITKFIYFGGASFYEADEFARFHLGVRNKSLLASNISNSGSFSNAFLMTLAKYYGTFQGDSGDYVSPVMLNYNKVKNLEELAKIIPELVKKKYFTTHYRFHGTASTGLSKIFTNTHTLSTDIKYNELDEKPRLFWFDEKENIWKSKSIL